MSREEAKDLVHEFFSPWGRFRHKFIGSSLSALYFLTPLSFSSFQYHCLQLHLCPGKVEECFGYYERCWEGFTSYFANHLISFIVLVLITVICDFVWAIIIAISGAWLSDSGKDDHFLKSISGEFLREGRDHQEKYRKSWFLPKMNQRWLFLGKVSERMISSLNQFGKIWLIFSEGVTSNFLSNFLK